MRLIQLLFIVCYSIFSPTLAYSKSDSSSYTIYVSPLGNAYTDGRSPDLDSDGFHGPFATLERAQHELRRLRDLGGIPNGATIYVREGTYELPNTFLLEAEDSGSPKAPIIFRAYKNEKVILSGGRQLSNCYSDNTKLITCNTSNLNLNTLGAIGLDKRLQAAPLPPFEVFVNEKRLQLTRWPNSDRDAPGGDNWAHVTTATKGARTSFVYRGESTDIAKLSDNAVIHIWPGNDWFDEYIGVGNKTPTNFILTEPTTYPIEPGRRFSILNEPETMDAPGEWHYSDDGQEISIIPIPDLKGHPPVVSYLDSIIEMNNTQNIRMEGFIIEHSRKTAIKITGGNSNTVENCIIRNTGGYGIEIKGGNNHTILQSEIHDTGYGGIMLKGGDRKTLTASSHKAISNKIHHTGRFIRTGKAALQLDGVGNIGSHNWIYNIPGTAVSIKGNDHLLELNDIHHACEESADCGAVYTGRDWTFHGNVIRYNRIHDIYGYGMKQIDASTGIVEYSTPYGARGVYLDDAVSGFEVIGNVFYRIPGMMIQIGGGRNNTVDNNIFITSGYAIWMDARWPGFPWKKTMVPRLNAVPYNEPVWRKRFPKLAEPMRRPHWPEGNRIIHNIIIGEIPAKSTIIPFRYAISPDEVEINKNIIWNHGKAIRVQYHFLKSGDWGVKTEDWDVIDWTTWQETGYDKNSLLTDPRFVDPIRGDFTLQQNSPARKMGIQEIPLKDIPTFDDVSLQETGFASPAAMTYRFKLQ